MRVLVTGATGFIGNHVILELLKQNIEVIASSRDLMRAKEYAWFPKVTYIPFTIGSEIPENSYDFFQQPDVCIHLSWEDLSNFKNVEHEAIFMERQLSFLTAIAKSEVKKISVVGTCLEYGMREGELSESFDVHPQLPYAIGKNNLRKKLEVLQKTVSFELDWIRLFYMYGEGQSPKSILAQLENHIENKIPVFNMSEGKQSRDYLPVKKVAEIIVKLALLNEGNGIINCCSGVPITILQLVDDFIKSKNADITLNRGYYPYPDYEPFAFWGDPKKLNTLLHEEPVNR